MKIKGTRITRQIEGQYFQTADGLWWVMNPQTGWVEVPTTSRALAFHLTR